MLALLDAWSRMHALAVLAACAVSLWTETAVWLSAVVVLSLALLVRRARAAWSPAGRFGAANWVTSLRLALAASFPVWPASTPGVALAGVLLAVFALDGLDGWLAQRLGTASEFGAHYDMETDAGLVLIAEIVLFFRGDAGGWILTTGLLRYVFVLTVALIPPRSQLVRRSRYGRWAFGSLMAGLVAAFALPRPFGVALAIAGTAAVSASFAYAFHAAYRVSATRASSGVQSR